MEVPLVLITMGKLFVIYEKKMLIYLIYKKQLKINGRITFLKA